MHPRRSGEHHAPAPSGPGGMPGDRRSVGQTHGKRRDLAGRHGHKAQRGAEQPTSPGQPRGRCVFGAPVDLHQKRAGVAGIELWVRVRDVLQLTQRRSLSIGQFDEIKSKQVVPDQKRPGDEPAFIG